MIADRYHTSFMDDESMHIVMEFAEKGDLYKVIVSICNNDSL